MCALIVVLFACIAYGFGFADGKRQKEAVERNCGKFTGETGTIKFKWNEKQ